MVFSKFPAETRKCAIALAAALVICLCITPLAACSGQSGSSSGSGSGTASSGAVSSSAASTQPANSMTASTASATVDTSSWKTLGDALANQTGLLAQSNDDAHYIIVFNAGNAVIRAVAKMQPDVASKADGLDFFNPADAQKLIEAIGDLELVSAEDISASKLSQQELDAFVGKTGKDLVEAGFAFSNYFMYGGEQTGADFDKDYYAYSFTFDVSVPEKSTEDGGAALMDATITDAQAMGNIGNTAIDPAFVDEPL